MSFQERIQLGLEELSKREPVTLEMARKQAQWLKEHSKADRRNNEDSSSNSCVLEKICKESIVYLEGKYGKR